MSLTRVIALSSSVALGAGMLAVLPLLGTPTAGAATPTITAVGSIALGDLATWTGTTATLSVTPANVGDVMVLAVRPFSGTITVAAGGVSGGGATVWTQLAANQDGAGPVDTELWMGPVTTAGANTITVTFSGSLTGVTVELAAQEYSSGLGTLTTWTRDTFGAASNGSNVNVLFPSLHAAGTAELYVGYAWVSGTTTSGSGSGSTWTALADSSTDLLLYDPNVSGTLAAPSVSQGTAGVSSVVAALLIANVAAPTATSILPTSGSTTGGTSVTITGTNFETPATVAFGATAATNVVVVNSTTITATSPAGTAGVANVTVTTPGGTSSTTDDFTYVGPTSPTVSAVSPSSGSTGGGTTVTVTGTNLTGATAVDFGTKAGTSIVVNGGGTSLTVVSPAGSVGTVDVTVTTPHGTSATSGADHFSYAFTTGYWMVGKDGGVFAFGNAGFVGSLPGIGVHVSNIVGVVPTATGKGYWMVGSDGGVFAFGDAGFVGSLPGIGVHVNDIVGVVPTSTGKGYWMVGSDGGVFAFGDAGFVGSLPGLGVHVSNIVGVVATSTGKGYWMVGSDGGVFAFGNAGFVGSLPGLGVTVNDIVAVVPTAPGA